MINDWSSQILFNKSFLSLLDAKSALNVLDNPKQETKK